jgi:predicted permease
MLNFGDVKYALRLMLTRPGFTLLTVLVLAGGFSISLYAFGALKTLVYGDLPVADGESIVRVSAGRPPNFGPLDAYELAQIRNEARGLTEFGAYRSARAVIGEPGSVLNARAIESDWRIFEFTGTEALHGRGFVQQDGVPGAEPVAVLGYALWQSGFAGDPDVVGSVVRLKGTLLRIVGVMPDGYRFPQNSELWLPLSQSVLDPPGPSGEVLNAYARLRADVPVATVEAELTTILQRLRAEYAAGESAALESVSVMSFHEAVFGIFGDVIFGVLNLLALSILLLAAVNVGNLLLARTNRRIREVGVRIALGATRPRLIAQVVLENLMLCALGGAAAVWLAARGLSATNEFMRQLLGANMPFWWIWRLDGDVLLVGLSSLVLTVTVVSVLPAVSVSRVDPNQLLREGSHGGGLNFGRVSRALVTLEVALIAALMLVGSVATVIAQRVANFDLGMDIDDMLVMTIEPSEQTPPTEQARLATYQRVLDEIRAAPEIAAAAILHDADIVRFSADGTEYPTLEEYPGAWRIVTSATDEPIGPTLIDGRRFDSRDTPTSLPTAMVSESLARSNWPNVSPLGQSIEVFDGDGDADRETESRVVVGVMSNISFDPAGMTSIGTSAVYLPSTQLVLPVTKIVARHRGDEGRARSAIYEALARADPTISPRQLSTYTEATEQVTRLGRTITALFAGCGAFAILLAITGIYGMSSNGVVLRRHEIGLRRALGASDRNVLRIFVAQGIRQLAVGLLFSALLSAVVLAVVGQSFSLDGPTLAMIGGIVVLVVSSTVLFSIYLSVRGVLRLEPGSALRFA